MHSHISNTQARIALLGTALLIGMLLLVRSFGLYPTVLSDEYFHSTFARIVPFSEAAYPSYFYYLIYSVTNIAGDGFLVCARFMNVIFFVAASPFVYLVARKVAPARAALLISAFALLAPINSYTAYFMPESMYFFFFWAFTWLLLSMNPERGILHWSAIGVFLGLTALIKPHAVFLLPSLATFLLLHHRFVPLATGKKRYALFVVFLVSALATKFALGFVFAGKAGLTLFGPSYTSQAPEAGRYLELIPSLLENGQGHVLGLFILFSVPVAQLILSSSRIFKRSTDESPLGNVALYALLLFAFMIPIVSLYTASLAGKGPYENNFRIHMRYYNFAFPLFLVVAASQLSRAEAQCSTRLRVLIALPIALGIAYGISTRLSPYLPNYVDSPQLHGILKDVPLFYTVGGFSFAALALWVYRTDVGAKGFLYVVMPLALVVSNISNNRDLRASMEPQVFDHAGLFAKQYLSRSNIDLSKLHVAGSNPYGVFKAMFHLESATLEVIPAGSGYDLSRVPPNKEWLLLIGDHSLSGASVLQLWQTDFVLANIRPDYLIDFTKTSWPGALLKHAGLAEIEPWGRWSSSERVTLEFAGPLPEKFQLQLTASAFGPNVEKEFVARVGEAAVPFTLSATPELRVLEFTNWTGAKTMTIEIPHAVSPRELGFSEDGRRLGIGLVEMRISPLQLTGEELRLSRKREERALR